MKNRWMIVIVCGTALLIAAVVVVALRERQPVQLPNVPVAQTPAEVRVKAVERKAEPVKRGEVASASDAVAIVCGMDEANEIAQKAKEQYEQAVQECDKCNGDLDRPGGYHGH